MDKASSMQIANDSTRHTRGKGDIGGGDLPMNNSANTDEDALAKSMPQTKMSDLSTGFCDHGSITGDTKSHAAMMKPGMQNKGSKAKVSGDDSGY